MNPRFNAQQVSASRLSLPISDAEAKASSEAFGIHVFNRKTMKKMLPKEIFLNLTQAMDGHAHIKPEYADTIAMAMKEWALQLGATHYSHWFQPLTGATAEKHDAFIDWATSDQVIEKFSGKQLIQGEPDASSFPSGGLRTTYEARGYTAWDPTSPPFLWSGGDGVTLCIPSIFFSWTGDVLDLKIPLLRSERKISQSTLRLLNLTGIKANEVYSTLGCEQEYFVIDRSWRNMRPDIVLTGRTVFGAAAPKGQELQDHYFGSVKDRILAYMRDFETQALKLGIPVKTRHNEVAPAQHEVAPVFERASVAIDHNILLMELMRQTALRHGLSCLLHEKPFHGINGSGKHCNWSLSTDTGINLLDPTDTPENNLHFLILLTAILNAVHKHALLLRASIGSASNDYRLGGHEAPPAIISVYLGVDLEGLLENIETKGHHTRSLEKIGYDLGVQITHGLNRDNTDRNRTSPFAFTGNKFEFRAVGSSANPSFPMTVLNTIVAESLDNMLDEIEKNLGSRKSSKQALEEAALPVIRKYLKASRSIRFGGDGYSDDWSTEAKLRKLPVVKKSIEAFEVLKDKTTIEAFKGILTQDELRSRYEILAEIYSHTLNIEAKLQIDLFESQVLPAAMNAQKAMAKSILAATEVLGKTVLSGQKGMLKSLTDKIEEGIDHLNSLKNEREKAEAIGDLAKRGKAFHEKVQTKGEELRSIADAIETSVDDTLWQLPKYREMLFWE